MDDMSYSRLRAQGSRCYTQLLALVDFNKSRSWAYYRSWAQGSWCYEQLKAMDYMISSKLWAQGSKCYEQL